MMLARLTLAAALFYGASAHSATLQHDLLQRPPLETLKPHPAESVKTLNPAPQPPAEWKPQLRAVIAGGGNAIVNVEGRILQMGQDIDGYRLVEVQERQATFVKDKVRHTLVLAPVKPVESGGGSSAAAAPTEPNGRIGSVKTSDVLAKPAASPEPARDDTKALDRKGR